MKKFLLFCLLGFSINGALAYDIHYVDGDNFSYEFNIFKPGEFTDYIGYMESSFEITDEYTQPFYSAAQKWAQIIKSSTNEPVKYAVLSYDDYNAAAVSLYVKTVEIPNYVTAVNAAINQNTIEQAYTYEPFDAMILLGLGINEEHPGWAPFTGHHALYHGDIPDLNVVVLHELMHSIGLVSYIDGAPAVVELFGGVPYGAFDKDFRIYKGDTDAAFDKNKEIVYQEGMIAGDDFSDFDVVNYSPYYTGKETIKVLGGKDNYDEAEQAIINNGGLTNYSSAYSVNERPKVYGLPIHPYDSDDEIDLSHVELRNSYMSHQGYRNWVVPMEAELAVLKDIGYDVDLREFFGKSYYLDNVEDVYKQGFAEWNGTNYTTNPSNVAQAVGIHIYGNKNSITQASNILTNGEGSFGVRMDGVNNQYTLATNHYILSSGKENIGLGVTWGKNHTINLENNSLISATGENGIAASFDFGHNIFGIYTDTKGSYINYNYDVDYNLTPEIDTQGALVDNFNVSGTLSGSGAAIYISDNAWVKNINIQDGAEIYGDIKSNWNSISSTANAKVLSEKYDEEYGFNDYLPRDISNSDEILYTNLNFTGESKINGNITGENEVYNTLIMNNAGVVNIDGNKINVNTLNNSGTINLSGNTTELKDIVNLEENSTLSFVNNKIQNVKMGQLNSDNANLIFDLGDTFTIENESIEGKNTVKVPILKVDDNLVKTIENVSEIPLFTDVAVNLDGYTNIYYDGNKYEIKQSDENKKVISITKDMSTVFELSDAAGDRASINYIVKENSLLKDAGVVNSEEFTITGNNINVNGNKGLVIDGATNESGTTLKTGIYGANDSDLTVMNNGSLLILSDDKEISLGADNETVIEIKSGNVTLSGKSNNPINITGNIKSDDVNNVLTIARGTTVNHNGLLDPVTVEVNGIENRASGYDESVVYNINAGGIVNFANDTILYDVSHHAAANLNTVNFNGGSMNTVNGVATNFLLSDMNLGTNGTVSRFYGDVDLENQVMDKFTVNNQVTGEGILNVAGLNLISDAKNSNTSINFTDNADLKTKVRYSGAQGLTALSPLYKYNVGYDTESGDFNFARLSTGGYEDYNPSVLTGAVAAQAGGYLTQLNSYDEAFRNMDTYMLMTKKERQAMKFKNKYVSIDNNLTYDPSLTRQENAAGWFRPYATFEKVPLKNGPKVENISYGSYLGGESKLYELKGGFDGMFGTYIGYNGSHQNYDGISVYQNGGTFGLSGMFYKGNFFEGLTANIGAQGARESGVNGSADFGMFMTGVASKTGYNFELADGKFIIQPNVSVSYSFVNTSDYHNKSGVKITSDPLHAIQVQPELKLIGNLKNGWQPYMSAAMIWNILDDSKFKANDVSLPELSVKPYVKYGFGVRKMWGERLTGFLQTYFTNGGRNGIGVQSGFRWALGR